jgi:IS1 family transposase
MWSFVKMKSNKKWIWLAIDVDSKQIVGVYVSSRDRIGAKGLWDSLPPVYRQCAVCYTDFWSAYEEIFPTKRHKAVGKESGKTNYIERFNCTMRQRISRLVRKTLSFLKKLENHIGAIWNFIHHYNAELELGSA